MMGCTACMTNSFFLVAKKIFLVYPFSGIGPKERQVLAQHRRGAAVTRPVRARNGHLRISDSSCTETGEILTVSGTGAVRRSRRLSAESTSHA